MRLWGGKDYLEAVRLAYVLINEHAEELNRLNVFPVPDGDTGINMSRTLAPVTHIREGYALNVVSQLASEAILRSSRGNSGSILATFFLGFAKAMERINEATSTELLAAFKRGTNESYQSLVDPTEGTILTVMRDVSNVTPKSNIETTLEAMENEAAASLKRTPTLLPILEKAGVVDAGGLGFYYLVKGFHLAALGLKKDIIDTVVDSEGEEPDIEEDANFRYCVEGILQKKEKFEGEGEAKDLRKELNDLGGSLVFIETAKVVKFHVHVNDDNAVGAVIGKYGTLLDYKVDNMERQVRNRDYAEQTVGFVPVINGAGFAELFDNFEIPEAPVKPMGHEASYEEFAHALGTLKSPFVVLLPNNRNAITTCELLMKEKQGVTYLPTDDDSQGLVALSHFDPEIDAATNLLAMKEALASSVFFRLAVAERKYTSTDVQVNPGDYIIVKDGEPIFASKRKNGVVSKCVELLQGKSIVTIYYGKLLTEEEAEDFASLLKKGLPEETDVMVLNGGQDVYRYLISGEK